MTTSSSAIWFITGTSTGFGRELTLALLERGYRVIATARKLTAIDDLRAAGAVTLTLDVTKPLPELEKIAQEAISIFGRIDYLVNNAGYALQGTIEESTNEEILNQLNTNFFGALNVTKSFLPHFRSRRSGMVIFNGSMAGWIVYPCVSFYHVTKFALEAIARGLSFEVAHLGIKVLLIEPGHFRTSILQEGPNPTSNRVRASKKIDDYKPVRELVQATFQSMDGHQVGDTKLAVLRIIDVATGTGMATGKPFPLRVALGGDAVEEIEEICKEELENIKKWKDLSLSTDSPNPGAIPLRMRDIKQALAKL